MADANDLQSLQGILLGLGLKDLPNLLMALHKARNAGKNLSEGRSHKDDGPQAQDQGQNQGQGPGPGPDTSGYDLESVLAPLLAQAQSQGQQPMPVNTPGIRPGMPPAPLPRMAGLPRTMQAGASPSGF